MVSVFGVDVFICHRGPDTKLNFVSGMLNHELRDRSVYVDTWALQPGEVNWKALLRTLQMSSIVLVVLSPRFQESAWCLEELCAAIEQGRLEERTGLVCTLRVVCFGKDSATVDEDQMATALVGLKDSQRRFLEAPELRDIAALGDEHILQRWRSAIQKAWEVVHWQFDGIGSHRRLEAEVADDIERALQPQSRDISSMKIGIQRRVNQLLDLPEMQKETSVRLLGLLGMGGIGKTILATALVDRLSSNSFGSSVCFVADVRSKAGAMEDIQHQIIKTLWPLGSAAERPRDKIEGRESISDKLRHQRVLLVLDDIEDGHAQWLIPERCNSGSIIIMTSRSRQALENAGCTVHHVNPLPSPQARELFLQHVHSVPSDADASSLVDKILRMCNGLPLSLKVVGSRLKGQPTNIWKETLGKLEAGDVLCADGSNLSDQLCIGYDGLADDQQREMFLDVACLFLGSKPDFAKHMWKRRNWDAESGLQMLINRGLVVVDRPDYHLEMHSHLRNMGRSIEHQRPRQRFWEAADLQQNGPKEIQVSWGAETYVEQERPRVAIQARELTLTVALSGSLEVLDLSDSRHLTALPANMASGNPSHMLLYGCLKLVALPESISGLSSLQTLELGKCISLAALPEGISGLSSLQTLDLAGCRRLATLPEGVSSLSSLQTLNLTGCSKLAALPQGISGLSSLQTMDLGQCYRLAALPESISGLSSLQTMNLGDCKSLAALPEGISGLSSLRTLELEGCKLTALPEGISGLSSLQTLNLEMFYSLDSLPEGISGLSSLQTLNLRDCEDLAALPQGISGLSSLQLLELTGCSSLAALPEGIRWLRSLQTLGLGQCDSLAALPEGISGLSGLQTLEFGGCKSLTALPEGISGLSSLQTLNLWLQHLAGLPESISSLSSLQTLDLGWCLSLAALPEGISRLSSLQMLRLMMCSRLAALPGGISGLSSLQMLDLGGCTSLTALPEGISSLSNLQTLNLGGCNSLTALPEGISGLSNLQTLELEGCDSITDAQRAMSLRYLQVL